MRFKPLHIGILTTVLLAVGAMGTFAGITYYAQSVLQPEAYAVWQTADLVIDYMEQHDGAWPRGWDDLRDSAGRADGDKYMTERGETTEVGFRPPTDVQRLQELVEVDWSADPRELARTPDGAASPPFHVIWLKSGRHTAFEGCEANQLIFEYLKGRYRVHKP